MSTLTIIDVGHGNAAVLSDAGKVVVVDTAGKTHLQRFLDQADLTQIDLVIISHTDADHLAGLINLLSNPKYLIKKLIINPDSIKGSALWEDVRYLIDDQIRRKQLELEHGISSCSVYQWCKVTEDLFLEVVSPSPAMALSGAGQILPRDGRKLTSNSVSIVLRVLFKNEPVALLTGDMDRIALDQIIGHSVKISAKYLVFPHHGGLPGEGTAESFTTDLLGAVRPESIIFSNGRLKFNNPNPEIIDASVRLIPAINILCTQLSKTCCENQLARDDYQPKMYSAGSDGSLFCAGTVEIDMGTLKINGDAASAHRSFVSGLPNSLCGKRA
ncbi:ComEC/Rec2 family competence protein [Pseudomonas sp. LS.1a]|uniref:ComEC/Rec2 family competence protein n=1 Tax=Pseudomonas sp. LS.1a TaxID=2920387 RepID=UPI001F1465BE|nr:MBL fold metallo-hydrolase [Pseudomonas sp. LS.1a]UMY59930.1 MBL fold metallo-hydrolase [Pseudomonas sp. LS.1a]